MNNTIIRTVDVDKSFQIAGREPLQVLKKVSVEIPEKTLTILRGPSGSGKTTLMNILGALDAPTAGKVYFGELTFFTSSGFFSFNPDSTDKEFGDLIKCDQSKRENNFRYRKQS